MKKVDAMYCRLMEIKEGYTKLIAEFEAEFGAGERFQGLYDILDRINEELTKYEEEEN